MTNYLIVMLLIAALTLNALRLHKRYNLAGLTTFLGRHEWYFADNSPRLQKQSEEFREVDYNGLIV